MKETWGDAKNAVKQVANTHKETAGEKADETRGKLSQSVENAKDKVKNKIEDFKERHSA